MSRNVSDLHPTLQKKVTELVALCKKNGISIKIGECVRTVKEQDALYAKGRTASGSIVTNAKGSDYKSMHQWGVAFDFYLDEDVDGDGKTSDDAFNNKTKLFNKVGKLGQSIGLEWGGAWKSITDLPHFQLPDWGSTPTKLKSQYGTPEKFMKTWKTTSTSTTTKTTTTTTTSSTKTTTTTTTTTAKVNVKEGVNFRKTASTKGSKICAIAYGKKVTVVKKNAATANGYTWTKIKYDNKTGYVIKNALTF